MIRMAERMTSRIGNSPAFVFIDIDDATWREWSFPLITPRDKLASLIEVAARSNPSAIVVDVDLAFPDATDREERLGKFLASYQAAWPPLLLNRALQPASTAGSIFPAPRGTVYDNKTKDRANILWGSPLFERSGDNSVRRWRLFTPACTQSGQPLTVPSIHLLAASIARRSLADASGGESPATGSAPWAELYRNLAILTPPDCKDASRVQEGVLDATPGLREVRFDHDDVSSRVIYRIAGKRAPRGLDRLSAGRTEASAVVAVRPARSILAAASPEGVPGLAGRVVLIGGSYAQSGDWHETPIGRMPGALLVINAIEALSVNGTPVEPSRVERLVTSLALVVLTAAAAAWFRATVVAIVVAAGLFVLMTISIARFQSGVMLDMAIPAVGAALHDLIEAAISLAQQVRTLGWKWVLKPEAKDKAEPLPSPLEGPPTHDEPKP